MAEEKHGGGGGDGMKEAGAAGGQDEDDKESAAAAEERLAKLRARRSTRSSLRGTVRASRGSMAKAAMEAERKEEEERKRIAVEKARMRHIVTRKLTIVLAPMSDNLQTAVAKAVRDDGNRSDWGHDADDRRCFELKPVHARFNDEQLCLVSFFSIWGTATRMQRLPQPDAVVCFVSGTDPFWSGERLMELAGHARSQREATPVLVAAGDSHFVRNRVVVTQTKQTLREIPQSQRYMQCSLESGDGVHEVLQHAVRCAVLAQDIVKDIGEKPTRAPKSLRARSWRETQDDAFRERRDKLEAEFEADLEMWHTWSAQFQSRMSAHANDEPAAIEFVPPPGPGDADAAAAAAATGYLGVQPRDGSVSSLSTSSAATSSTPANSVTAEPSTTSLEDALATAALVAVAEDKSQQSGDDHLHDTRSGPAGDEAACKGEPSTRSTTPPTTPVIPRLSFESVRRVTPKIKISRDIANPLSTPVTKRPPDNDTDGDRFDPDPMKEAPP